MAAGVSEVLMMVEVGLVNLLEVIVELGKLLLGFGVSGKLVILDTSWVLTEWVLVHVSLLGLCARQNCVNGDSPSADRSRSVSYDAGGVSFQN